MPDKVVTLHTNNGWRLRITVITLKVSSYSCSPLRLRDKKKRKVKKIHAQGLMVPFLLSHPWRYTLIKDESRKGKKRPSDEPTLKCQRNPFIGALGIQEPVMPGEPLIEC